MQNLLLGFAAIALALTLLFLLVERRDHVLTAAEHAARLRSDPDWTARETARLRAAPEPDAVASVLVTKLVHRNWENDPVYTAEHVSGAKFNPGDTLVISKVLRNGVPA